MKVQRIASPDYDFRVESNTAEELKGKFFFTAEESIRKCLKGSATITINSSTHIFKAGSNFFLGGGMYFKIVECSDDFEMISCLFSLQFFNEIYAGIENRITDVLWFSAPDLYTDEELLYTNMTIDKICLLNMNKNYIYRHKIIVNLVLCYIYEIYEFTHLKFNSIKNINSNHVEFIMDKFFILCHDYHVDQHKIDYYASKLNITSRYLSTITKKTLQTTPKEIIDYYISGTAKRLLLTTALTNQQIADKLNFPDQATFGQFFKRNVGMPPNEFRNRYK